MLVTSRQPDTAVRAYRPRAVEVGPFSPREALAYLSSKLHADPDQWIGALDLAGDLGYLPIALAQAAALMADTGLDCREYRARVADRMQRLAGAAADPYPSIVASTWALATEFAEQIPPAGLARPGTGPGRDAGSERHPGCGAHQPGRLRLPHPLPAQRPGRRDAGPRRPVQPGPGWAWSASTPRAPSAPCGCTPWSRRPCGRTSRPPRPMTSRGPPPTRCCKPGQGPASRLLFDQAMRDCTPPACTMWRACRRGAIPSATRC